MTSTEIGVQFGLYPTCESAEASLRSARDDGFAGVVLNDLARVSASLDPQECRHFAKSAVDAGLFVQAGIGCVGPAGDPADVRAALTRRIRAGVEAGADELFTYTRSDRTAGDHAAQLSIIATNLGALAPVLRSEGVRLNLKTHEDLSSVEVERLVDGLDADRFAISVDVANLVVRGEDPVASVERLAPRVRMTHLEDIAVFVVDEGLRRRLRPVGHGVLEWERILRALVDAGVTRFTLEQHRGRFDTPIFDRSWFRTEPQASGADIGQLVRMATRTEALVGAGLMPDLAALDAEPEPAERRAQLIASRSFLADCLDRVTDSTPDHLEER